MTDVPVLEIPDPELSVMERIAMLPSEQREEAIRLIVPEVNDLADVRYMWPLWARPSQLPPTHRPWFTWLIRKGRGAGKTRTGAEWVIQRARDGYGPMALVGQTKADVRDTMIELGESSILKVSPPGFRPVYEPSKRRLTWPNGVTATVFSGDEPNQLRGPQHATIWSDELAKWMYPQEAYDNAVLGLRLSDDPKHLITTTPRPIPTMRSIVNDPMTIDVTGSTFENIANLSPIFIQQILRMYSGTRLGLQEIYGLILEDTEGALWTLANIEEGRIKSNPDMVRVVVGVDPKASAEAESETGIVVAGVDANREGYVIADYSVNGRPEVWAAAVVKAYNIHQADAIVAEVNNGGDMVEHTIQTVRDEEDNPIGYHLPIYKVHASRGKRTRAEPISNLYAQGRVHHLGTLDKLEDQLCLTADTLITTQRGDIRIDEVKVGDMALTRYGFREVTWAGMTRQDAEVTRIETSSMRNLCGTMGHPVYTVNRGFVRIRDLEEGDELWELKSSTAEEYIPLTGDTTGTQQRDNFFTAFFGRKSTDRSRMDTTSTTGMKTRSTMTWGILNVSLHLNIENFIPRGLRCGLLNSTRKRPVNNGKRRNPWSTFAMAADKSLKALARVRVGVPSHVHASFTAPRSWERTDGTVKKLTRKTAQDTRQDVYNLTVKGDHEYYANGILVHNSTWVPDESPSPDRLDAMVWALSALMVPQVKTKSRKRRRRSSARGRKRARAAA